MKANLKDIQKVIKEVFLTELGFKTYPQLKGDIVKITNPLEDEDPNMKYVVIEEDPSIYSDDEGILVQALGTGLSFPPVSRIVKKDLHVVTPASQVVKVKKDSDKFNGEIGEAISGVFNEENIDEERIANHDAKDYVERKENFLGTHIFAERIGEDYVVCSYIQEFPIFIYDSKKNKWYENSDEFKYEGETIEQAQEHKELVRPTVVMHTRTQGQMLSILQNIMKRNGVENLTHESKPPGTK